MVERHLAKVAVVGSNPIARSIFFRTRLLIKINFWKAAFSRNIATHLNRHRDLVLMSYPSTVDFILRPNGARVIAGIKYMVVFRL